MSDSLEKQQPQFFSCVIDSIGRLLSVGPLWETLFTSAKGIWIGELFIECMVTSQRENSRSFIEKILANQTGVLFKFDLPYADGTGSKKLNFIECQRLSKDHICLIFETTEETARMQFVDERDSDKIGIWNLNLKTNELKWSQSLFKIFDFSDSEMDGNPDLWEKRIHPDDRDRTVKFYHELVAKGRDISLRFRILVRRQNSDNRELKYILLTGVVDHDDSGKPVSVRGVMMEIDREQYNQHSQIDSTFNISDLFENLQVGMVIQNHEGRIIQFNKKALDILGLSETELLGRASIDPRWKTVNENGLPFPGESHPAMVSLRSGIALTDVPMGIRKSDGKLTWISINTTPVFENQTTKPTRVVATFTDVTERMRALNHLKDQSRAIVAEKQRFEHLIYGLNQTAIVSLTDLDGVITYANEMFCKISGYDESELIGRNHRVINSGIHPTEFFAEMWSTVLRGVVWRREICNKRKDGSLYWVDSTIVPLKNVDGRVQELMAIRFDVTAAKETKLKLLQASKMAALGEASAHLAHEVNTPLAVIISKVGKILKMMSDGELNTNLVSHEVEKVQKTANQISEIIKGLKHFSRSADKDLFQVCELDVVLKEVLVLCGERLDEEG
ncbi:MAG TPA: PAS domain S-box protein, partial [Pseudobdellovibrionaceae bacterium]|nr:PAS domain S-box protein [Pseudobdellovibrionaceae bacterium]